MNVRLALAIICCTLLLAQCVHGQVSNPIVNPSFEAGLTSPWYSYSYLPQPPQLTGNPSPPTVGTCGGTFNALPPYTTPDGSYVCGMESSSTQSKNGGVYQTFSWPYGGGEITVRARALTNQAGGGGCAVRLGVAAGATSNRTLVSSWTQTTTSDWTTLKVVIPANQQTSTVFIESYQPGGLGYVMSTLWDDVRWTPYIALTDTPTKAGADPSHPDTTARIVWHTNLPSTSRVDYRSGTGTWQSVESSELVYAHDVTITNLQPSSTCTFNVTSSAPGCTSVTSGNYSFVTPIQISNVSATTGDPNVVVTWQSDVASNSYVEYGLDTSYGQVTGTVGLTSNHSVTVTGLQDGKTYHYRVRCGAPSYSNAYSGDYTFTTLPAPHTSVLNGGFESLNGDGTSDMYPWGYYLWAAGDLQINGIIGPYPKGGATSWFPTEVGLQAYEGSYFLGAGSRYTYRNGGVYQRISLSSPQTIGLSAKFATYQSAEGGTKDTRVDLGIDPTGGMNPNASTVVWWRGVSPTNDNKWYPGGLIVDAPQGVSTIFVGTRELYGLASRAVAIDDVVCAPLQDMSIGQLRQSSNFTCARLQDKIVTYVDPDAVTYEDKSYRKVYIQEPNVPSGIAVLLGPSPTDVPTIGNKLTVSGALMPLGTEVVVMGYKWAVDHGTYTLPRPMGLRNRDIGGSAVNQASLLNAGTCTLGSRIRLFGRLTYPDIGIDGDVYIDDGSHIPTSLTDPYTGQPVKGVIVRLRDIGQIFYQGDYIAATGVLTIDNLGSTGWPDYQYVLVVTSVDDWQVLSAAPQQN